MKREEILEKEFKVLDKGFVRLVDVMGDDNSIVQAARVSYGKGTKTVREDRGLIRYLIRHKHTTPLEMVEFKFHIKLPIFVARQWIRHRTANVNEYSGRYSEMTDDFYLPDPEQIRPQSTMNRQGRSEEIMSDNDTMEIRTKLLNSQLKLYDEYKELLDKDLARELARINLPLSNYTEWYWKIDLHNLMHFLKLRLDSHAQYEIRVYAEAMANIVKEFVPVAWEAYEDYHLNSVTFSGLERTILNELLQGNKLDDINFEDFGLRKREEKEFKEKFNNILNS